MASTINNGATYLPAAGEGPVPQWHGTYTGIVVDNHDPQGIGRLRLHVPQVLGNSVSGWALPLGTYLSVPANGATVSAAFVGGDPGQPVWSGALNLSPVVNTTGAAPTVYSIASPPDPVEGEIWYPIIISGGGAESVGTPQVWTFNSGTDTFSWVTQPSLGTSAINNGAITEALLGTDVTGLINSKSTTVANLSTSIPPSANLGDIWMQVNATGIITSVMLCTTAYTSGGVQADWTTETSMNARAIGSPYTYQQSLTPNTANNGSNPPQLNDLWINTGSSNVIEQMTGGTSASPVWTQFQIGSNAIQNGTIKAGMVDGTLVTGASIVATGTSGDFLGYTGTPATGNLFVSVSPVSGTDTHSNTYPAGINISGSSNSYALLANNTGIYGVGVYMRAAGLTFNAVPAAFATQAISSGSSTSEVQYTVVSSGKQSNGTLQNDSALQLFSASPDGSVLARAAFEFGGVGYLSIHSHGIDVIGSTVPAVQLIPSNTSHVSTQPFFNAQALNAGAANEQMLAVVSSGKENGNADAAMQFFAAAADNSSAARYVLEFGGAVGLTVNASSVNANVPITNNTGGTTYGASRYTTVVSSSTGINNTGDNLIPGLTCSVPAGNYRVSGILFITMPGSGPAQMFFAIVGTSSSGGQVGFTSFQNNVPSTVQAANVGANSYTSVGPTGTASATYQVRLDGVFAQASSGGLEWHASCGAGSTSFTVARNSVFSVEPL